MPGYSFLLKNEFKYEWILEFSSYTVEESSASASVLHYSGNLWASVHVWVTVWEIMKITSFESSLLLYFRKLSVSFPLLSSSPWTFNITAHDSYFLCIYKEAFFTHMFLRCCLIINNYDPRWYKHINHSTLNLGITLNEDNNHQIDLKERIKNANKTYFMLQKFFKNENISKKTKIKAQEHNNRQNVNICIRNLNTNKAR
jgi:hypothetical protein